MLLSTLFGGNVRRMKCKRSYNDTKYERWDWGIGTRSGAFALKSMLPYLRVKRAEAELALSFQATMNRRRGPKKVEQETLEFPLRLEDPIRLVEGYRA